MERPRADGLNVVVTGGSRGLGLEIAKEWARRGATVAICGRDRATLEMAERELRTMTSEVAAVVCDVGDESQVRAFLGEVHSRFGEVDVLVNNAGVLVVGPASQQRLETFEEAMRSMYWGMVYASLSVLPKMLDRHSGRIVNITSIGGKVSSPHLLPYSSAKSAALAFSNGLQAEAARSGVSVTTVIPGFMRTGSQENAAFIGMSQKEYRWFTFAGNLPFISISAERAAERIVNGALEGRRQVIITPLAQAVVRFIDVAPTLTSYALEIVNRLLPRPPREPASTPPPRADKGEALEPPAPVEGRLEGAAAAHNQRGDERLTDTTAGYPTQVTTKEASSMSPQQTSIIGLLLADHKKVEGLLSKIDSIELSKLEDYFCELREELVRHEVAEEMSLYPAVRQYVPEGDAISETAIHEQSLAEEKLATMEKEPASSEAFRSQLKELRTAVLEHARHEETTVFPALSAHRNVEQLEELGERYERALKAAPTHPHPHAPDTPPGNFVAGPVAKLADKMRDAMKKAA